MSSRRRENIAPRQFARFGVVWLAMVLLFSRCAFSQGSTAVPGTTPVGQSAAPVPVIVTMSTTGVGSTTAGVTLGSATKDFGVVSSACQGSYQVGSQCVVSVTFSPVYPGLRRGAVVVTSSSGQLLGSALVSGSATGSLAALTPGDIYTVAGNGELLYRSDNVQASSTPVYLPQSVVTDAAGNVYISDTENNRIRKVDTNGIITTVAGDGQGGYSGDGGAATQANIAEPSGITLDGAGNIYFADSANNLIRRVDAYTGIITTIAGVPGKQGYSGDNGPATSAWLSAPRGIAFDANGDLFIADTGNNVVREINAATGAMTTVAGTGVAGYNGDGLIATQAQLNTPWNVAVGLNGSLYIADLSNNIVRKINAAGILSIVAGTGSRGYNGDGGSATAAVLNSPAAVAIDPAGEVYIADSGNNRVRKIDVLGNIYTIIGSGAEAFGGDNGPAPNAGIYAPYALHFDQTGTLYLSDLLHNRIRAVAASPVTLQYPDMRVGKVSAPQALILENHGNDQLALTTPTYTMSALDSGTTTCVFPSNVGPGGTCNLGVEFTPTVTGASVQGTLALNSNAANNPALVNLYGQVLSVEPVTVGLTATPNPSLLNNTVTFTATVGSSDPNVSGPVTFYDGTTAICSNISINSGIAACSTSVLTLGQHTITASYGGNANNEAKTSAPLIQIVQQASTIVLSVTPNPAVAGSSVTITATVTAATGTPTGAVVFYDGTTALTGNVTTVNGVATTTTSQLAPGTHNISAKYAGDANDAGGTSNIVAEIVTQASTTTALSTSSANPYVGSVVSFTATVSGTNGTTLTGSVQFMDGATALGTQSLSTAGTATLQVGTLTPGQHNITATYSGDTNDGSSTSSPITEAVQQIPTLTTLSSDNTSPSAGAVVHLTATVSIMGQTAAAGAITGSVSFSSGSTVLGSAQVDGSGHATLAASLQSGANNIIATYQGNTNYATSTSAALSEQVSTTATTTSLTASASASLAGKPVIFTAVVASATGIPSGSVTFTDATGTLGVAPLVQGVATFATTSLSVSTHNVVATYGGDGNYITSHSSPVADIVSLATTSLTLAGPSTAVVNTAVTVTGTIVSNGVTPTGPLNLLDGGTLIATQSVSPSGSFVFSTSLLSIGTHVLSVTYAGDADNSGSASATLTLAVQQATTATALVSSASPSTLGATLTFTATVTSMGTGITGTVNFLDGSTSLGSVAVVNGSALFSTSSLAFGTHSITAVYVGDPNHSGSTSPVLTQQIVQTAPASLTSNLNPATSGLNVTFTARLAAVSGQIATGSVIFLDGANALGTAALDGSGAAVFSTSTLTVGTHIISFSYAGDKNFAAATASLTQTIQNANTQVSLQASANPATYGAVLNLSATVTSNGGVATGPVTFTEGGTTLGSAVLNGNGVATLSIAALSPGLHSVIANYAGDGKASSSVSAPLSIPVLQTTVLSLASSANPALTLSPITLTASVKNALGGETGLVTFTDGATQLGTASLDASGVATLTLAPLSAGSHAFVASYAGDAADFPGTATLAENVMYRPTVTTVTSSQTSTSNAQQVTLIAVVRYTGPQAATGVVTFSAGGTILGTSTIDSTGVASFTIQLQGSSAQIVAAYGGDAAYASSTSDPGSVTIGQATQFTLALSSTNITLQSEQHTAVTLNVASVKNFTDTLEFGCLGQPAKLTCTFSQPQMNLASNGNASQQLTIDTANPIGSSASASSIGGTGRTLLFSLPVVLLLGFGLLRKKLSVPVLLVALFTLAVSLATSGCAGLSSSGVAPGTYTFLVTATGKATGVTQSQTITLTVQ